MNLEWNKENNTISVGQCVFTDYVACKGRKTWVNYVLQKNGIDNWFGCKSKESNKAVSDLLGCSSAGLYKHFLKLQYLAFVVPYKDLLMKLAYKPGWVDSRGLRLIKKNADKLRQAQADGTYNIMPFIMYFGLTPKEFKDKYKGAWKVVANNSFTKNKAIAEAFYKFPDGCDMAVECAHYPTTVIKSLGSGCCKYFGHVTKFYKGRWGKMSVMSEAVQIIQDTARLADQLGEVVNFKWSPRRFKEEHDRMAKAVNALRYSPEPFKSLENVAVRQVVWQDGYVATLLDSAALIGEEGTAMGHCVGGYAEYSRNGGYLVYSITKCGERSSTLGITCIDGKYIFNQHYGRYNKPVDSECEKALAKEVLSQLNKKESK